MKTLMSVIRDMSILVEEAVDLEESTAEYAKSLEKIANDKKLKAISKSDKATLSKLADMMKNANEEFIEEAVSNLDEMLDDIIAEDYFTVQYYDAKGKAEEGKSKDFGDEKSATKHLDKANKVVKDGEYKMFKVKGSMDEAFESIEEAMDNWTITVDKAVNKLKKGDEQKVKARSAFEAINKAMKLWGDPSLKAAPFNAFKVTKEGLEEERLDPSEYTVGAEKSKKGYRALITYNKATTIFAKGFTMYFSSDTFKDEKDAKAQAQAYLDGYVRGGDRAASKDAGKFAKKNDAKLAEEVELVEHVSKRQQDTLKGFSSNSYGISDSLISAVNNVVTGKAESVEMPTGEENSVIEQGVQELGEAKNPNIGKIVQGVTDLQNKLKGKDGRDIGKVLTQIRKGDADRAQGVIRGLDTDIRDQLQDVLEPLGAWKKGVYVSESIVEGADGGTGDKEEYQKFFQAALKKFGASSPADLDDKKKKEFYDYVDANWEGDDEVAENALKEFKADGEDSESADPTDVKAKQPKKAKKAKAESKDGTDDEDKKGGEKVEINPKLDEEKRDQILKGLQEKMPEFKKKYGDRCEEVMYATATKLAMK